MYGCVGSYLQPSGISSVLVATECFGSEVVNSVMEGTHYVRSKEGILRVHESILSRMIEEFTSHTGKQILDSGFINSLISGKLSSWDNCKVLPK